MRIVLSSTLPGKSWGDYKIKVMSKILKQKRFLHAGGENVFFLFCSTNMAVYPKQWGIT